MERENKTDEQAGWYVTGRWWSADSDSTKPPNKARTHAGLASPPRQTPRSVLQAGASHGRLPLVVLILLVPFAESQSLEVPSRDLIRDGVSYVEAWIIPLLPVFAFILGTCRLLWIINRKWNGRTVPWVAPALSIGFALAFSGLSLTDDGRAGERTAIAWMWVCSWLVSVAEYHRVLHKGQVFTTIVFGLAVLMALLHIVAAAMRTSDPRSISSVALEVLQHGFFLVLSTGTRAVFIFQENLEDRSGRRARRDSNDGMEQPYDGHIGRAPAAQQRRRSWILEVA